MAVKREPPEVGPPPPAKKYTTKIKTSALYANDFTSLLATLKSLGVVDEIRCGESAVIETAEDLKDVKSSERQDITITMSSPEIEIRLSQNSRVQTSDPTSARARETTDRIAGLFTTWSSITPRFTPIVWLLFPSLLVIPGMAVYLVVSAVRQDWVDIESPSTLWLVFGLTLLPGLYGVFATNTRVVVHPVSRFERTERVRKFYGTLVVGLALNDKK
jgi:hypothetical protein